MEDKIVAGVILTVIAAFVITMLSFAYTNFIPEIRYRQFLQECEQHYDKVVCMADWHAAE